MSQIINNDQSVNLMGSLISQSPMAVTAADSEFRIQSWNHSAESLFGYTYAEVIGKYGFDVLQSQLNDAERAAMQKKLVKLGWWEGQVDYLHKNGSKFKAVVAINTVRNDETITGYFIVAKRVFENSSSQFETTNRFDFIGSVLQTPMRNVDEILNRITDGVISLDIKFRCRYINPSALNIIDREYDQMLGRIIWEAIPAIAHSELYADLHDSMLEQKKVNRKLHYLPDNRWFEYTLYPSSEGVTIYFKETTYLKKSLEDFNTINTRLKLIEKFSKDVIWDLNIKAETVWWSDNYYHLLAYEKGEVVPTIDNWVQSIHPEDRENAYGRLQSAIAAGQEYHIDEYRYIDAKGQILYVVDRAFIMRDEQGVPERIIGVMADLSETQAARMHNQIQSDTNKMILESMLDCFLLADDTGMIVDLNQAYCKKSGYSREELLGMNIMQLEATLTSEQIAERIPIMVAGGYPKFETKHRKKDGSLIEFEVSISAMQIEGRQHVAAFMRDLTKRKKSELERKRLASILEATTDFVVITDMELKPLFINQAALDAYGWRAADMNKIDLTTFGTPESVQRLFNEVLPQALEHGQWEGELDSHSKDGRIIPVSMVLLLHKLPDETPGYISIIARDVSQERTSKIELNNLNKQLRELSSHLQSIREEERAHISREIHDELGQLLTCIKLDASWVKKKMPDMPADILEKINSILDVSDQTVKSLRKIAMDLRPAVLDDAGLIAALEWQNAEFEKRTGIKAEFHTTLDNLQMDSVISNSVFRVFQETLTNISRHAKATEVFSSIKLIDNQLLLTVHDNGEGFDINEVKEKRTLGILGMKERTLQMNGTYTITCKPNEGTTALMSIPLIQA